MPGTRSRLNSRSRSSPLIAPMFQSEMTSEKLRPLSSASAVSPLSASSMLRKPIWASMPRRIVRMVEESSTTRTEALLKLGMLIQRTRSRANTHSSPWSLAKGECDLAQPAKAGVGLIQSLAVRSQRCAAATRLGAGRFSVAIFRRWSGTRQVVLAPAGKKATSPGPSRRVP